MRHELVFWCREDFGPAAEQQPGFGRLAVVLVGIEGQLAQCRNEAAPAGRGGDMLDLSQTRGRRQRVQFVFSKGRQCRQANRKADEENQANFPGIYAHQSEKYGQLSAKTRPIKRGMRGSLTTN